MLYGMPSLFGHLQKLLYVPIIIILSITQIVNRHLKHAKWQILVCLYPAFLVVIIGRMSLHVCSRTLPGV